MSRPIVVIPCCTKEVEGHVSDAVRRRYSAAVAEVAGCQPLLIPLGAALADFSAVLGVADGVLLTGSPSNVEPRHYSDEKPALPDRLDPARDALTLPLAKAAFESKLPLFAICRGIQELNVTLGGSLHQEVHQQQGLEDHRAPPDASFEGRWDPRHHIRLTGRLRDWIGRDEVKVNSLHGQGLKRLAPMLTPEAFAPDGLVEAVRGPDEHPFLLGVQWHPEWDAQTNPISIELFRRFGAAARSSKR